ncbi:unnamed protein product [Linum trigynum]|uniref:F-box domain-containing protein n=1 Tax=Linum trigynum TaxID=586398 RepID=A0AAV2DQG4_9ROSI
MPTRNPNKKIRIKREPEEEQIHVDRLSSLPDHILHYILSYFDSIKLSAQTSVLSTRWRYLWTHVHRLILDTDESFNPTNFARIVNEVMYNRSEECNICSIDYIHMKYKPDKMLLNRVVRFAASRDCQQFCLCVPHDAGSLDSSMFVPLANSNLRTLILREACLGLELLGSTRFAMLRDLDLDECWLSCQNEYAVLDPFANFPCLENLVLRGCILEHSCRFKISGPRLVKLAISFLDCSKLEIDAPNLKFFGLWEELEYSKLYQFNLPSLELADIWVKFRGLVERNKDGMMACATSLLRGLHNASSLFMNSAFFELLVRNSEFLENQCCPFTRLTSLTVDGYVPDMLPYHVMSYFLSGSSNRGSMYLEFV